MPDRVYAEPFTEEFGVGAGWQEVVTEDNPGAGLAVARGITGEYITRPVAVSFTYTASAGVANRLPVVRYEDGNGGILAEFGPANVQTANQVARYTFALGINEYGSPALGVVGAPLADVFLEAGRIIRITAANIAVADTITAILLTLDQFPTGPHGRPHAPRRRRQ